MKKQKSQSLKSVSRKKKSLSSKRKSKTTTKKKFLFLQRDIPFSPLPQGLIEKNKYLVWKIHPWAKGKVPVVRSTLYALYPKHVSQRTKGWGAIFPKTSWARTALALEAPEAFLVYELQKRPTWGPNMYKVVPKFPIVAKLPLSIENRILDKNGTLTEKEYRDLILVDIRGIQAAYNRARQHESKYGTNLSKFILQLISQIKTQNKKS